MAEVPHSLSGAGLVGDEEPNGYLDPKLSISSGVGVLELDGEEAIGG